MNLLSCPACKSTHLACRDIPDSTLSHDDGDGARCEEYLPPMVDCTCQNCSANFFYVTEAA